MAKTAKKKETETEVPKKAAAKKTAAKKAAVSPEKAAVKEGVLDPENKDPKLAGKKPAAKKAKAGLFIPLTVSPELAAIIGNEPAPRTEITKKIWDYIKQNNLQDSENRRMINADEKLKVVFGGKEQVSMFELAKIISGHVTN